jgi:hypothetical protein
MTTAPTDQEKPALSREELDAKAEAELRRQFFDTLRACDLYERKWLRKVMENGGRVYGAAPKGSVHRMLRRPHVQLALKVIQSIQVLELEVTMHRVQREAARIAFARFSDAYNADGSLKKPSEWDDDLAAAVCEYTHDKEGRPTIRLHAKGPSLEMLVRLSNLGPPQRVELTGKDGAPLNQAIPIIQFARYSDADAAPDADPQPEADGSDNET